MQAHVFISGAVQGVGFRQFVRNNAQKLGLTGWVRNAEDGGVEAVLQGDEEAINKMIAICKEGSMLSVVKQVGFEWEETTNTFTEFTIQL